MRSAIAEIALWLGSSFASSMAALRGGYANPVHDVSWL